MRDVNGWQVVVGVLGAGFVSILGWALHGLINGVNSRLDAASMSMNARMDAASTSVNTRIDDVISRIGTLENRITGIEGSLATIHKDVGILLGGRDPGKA